MKVASNFSFFFFHSSLLNSSTLLIVVWGFIFILTSCNNAHKESDDISFALSEIRQMKKSHERGEGKEFYLHMYRAEKALEKYSDDSSYKTEDSTVTESELEARAETAEFVTDKIWHLVWVASGFFILLAISIFGLILNRKRKIRQYEEKYEDIENLEEELAQLRLQYSNSIRSAVEQKAKISIVSGMLPLIDRMKIEVGKLQEESGKCKVESAEYISELITSIEKQNAMLTQWIKLHQGSVSPKIETLPLQEVFDVISKNNNAFAKLGITLNIKPTEVTVKADRTLTLFLLNTLTDNARKATQQGGTVTVACEERPGYAEISVCDTGKGMTEEQTEHLFEYKPISDDGSLVDDTSHKFGLQNCRGIIDRYRKISSLFSCCTISAESTLGKGTMIRFRLPLAAKMLVVMIVMSFNSLSVSGQTMEQEVMNANYAMLAVLLLIASLIPLFWFLYLKPVVKFQKAMHKKKIQLKEETKRLRAEFSRVHLINNIADNQLSTIKHETMFYPTRLQQQMTQYADGDVNVDEIQNTINYYREIFAMLSTKALGSTVTGLSFPAKIITKADAPAIIANEELLSYLLLLLKRHNKGETPEPQLAEASAGYIKILFPMPNLHLTPQQQEELFTPDTIDIDFLIMRQIIRETGEASLHYACGIQIELPPQAPRGGNIDPDCSVTTISITLPIKC